MDTIRLIDYSNQLNIQKKEEYNYIYEKIECKDKITNYNYYQKIIPDNYKLSLEKNFYRTKYEGKITVLKIGDFIRKSLDRNIEMYYENDFLVTDKIFSNTLTGISLLN